MKTIRIDGHTYAAVEVDENVACKGCIFYTVGWLGHEYATMHRS